MHPCCARSRKPSPAGFRKPNGHATRYGTCAVQTDVDCGLASSFALLIMPSVGLERLVSTSCDAGRHGMNSIVSLVPSGSEHGRVQTIRQGNVVDKGSVCSTDHVHCQHGCRPVVNCLVGNAVRMSISCVTELDSDEGMLFWLVQGV